MTATERLLHQTQRKFEPLERRLETHETAIRPAPPYDGPGVLAFLSRCTAEPVDIVEGMTLHRALDVGGTPVVVTATMAGGVDDPAISVNVTSERLSASLVEGALVQLRRLLNTDVDAAAFLSLAGRDPRLAAIAGARRGLRPAGTPTVFEAVIWAITGQHIGLGIACMLKRNLVELYGRRYAGMLLFPDAATLAKASPDDLGRSKFTRSKALAITGFARAVAEGEFDPESLRSVPQGEAMALLMAFRGIGRWTAEYVLARGVGDPDAYPAGDAGLRRAVGQLLGEPNQSEERTREFAEPYAGWRAHLAFLLWSTL